jgi:hypothetical protein
MAHRALLLAAGVLAALVAAGCATARGKLAPSKPQFIASADAVCLLEQDKLAFIAQRAGKLAQVPPAPLILRQQVAANQRATAKLESLTKPPADGGRITRWLTARTVAATVALDLAEAPRGHDARAVKDVIGELGRARARERGLAQAYGLRVCNATQ